MPFVPNTPESHAAILSPAPPTVCRGVSNDGKPCKRTLVRSSSGDPESGVITIVGKQQAYFCARHQDQAKEVVLRHTASFARRRALVGRGSMDTLIEQVELLVGGGDSGGQTIQTTVVSTTKKVPREKDPFKPVLKDYDEEEVGGAATPRPPSPPSGRPKPKKKQPSLLKRLFFGCCMGSDDDPEDEKNWSARRREAELRSAAAAVVDETFPTPPARAKKADNKAVAFKSVPPTPPLPMMYLPKHPASAIVKNAPVPATKASKAVGMGLSPATPMADDDVEDVPEIDVKSLTKEQQHLLKLIPKTVHPRGLGRLQQELLKPFSDKDEPGYIYMFWLTDSPLSPFSTPSGSTAATPSAGGRSNTASDRLMRAALNAVPTPGGTRPKLLFKIGRAVNVQRRLHQWTSQCGYNLALIRYYPHTSASSPGESPIVARKAPNCNRIERLIHLELSATPGANPKKNCETCGKTHQEWFEVEASREGILAVDEVIKRWIAYGERSATTSNPTGPSPKAKMPARPNAPQRHNAAQPGPNPVKMYTTKTPSPQTTPKKAPAAPRTTPKKAAAAATSPAATPKKNAPTMPKKQAPSTNAGAGAGASLKVPAAGSRQRSSSSSPSAKPKSRSSSKSRQRSSSTHSARNQRNRSRSTSRRRDYDDDFVVSSGSEGEDDYRP